MDEVDEAIVSLLEVDGRLTHREIAERVGLSRSVAATRVQRLIDSGQVVVRGVAHPAACAVTRLFGRNPATEEGAAASGEWTKRRTARPPADARAQKAAPMKPLAPVTATCTSAGPASSCDKVTATASRASCRSETRCR